MNTVTVRAPAKINLALRVLGARRDGYHDLRTLLQSIALHDTLTFHASPGEFRLQCDDPVCPADRTNLVWRAVELAWRASGRRGAPRNLTVRLVKRIPMQSGLGGGSSDAAAALRGLSAFLRFNLSRERRHALAAELGADVAFFLRGGTSLCLERGDVVVPVADQRGCWVVLVIPGFGVSTQNAYRWWDDARESRARGDEVPREVREGDGWHNDLEPVVALHHPSIAAMVRALRRRGASHAAMSGSGSAVFGLFTSRLQAEAAARALGRRGTRSIVTRTLSRTRYGSATAPRRP